MKTTKEEFKERSHSHREKQIVSGLAHGPFSLGPARALSLKRPQATAAGRSKSASFKEEETTPQNVRVFNDQDELFSESPSPVGHKESIPSFDFTSAFDVPLSSPGTSFFNFDLISNTAKLTQREKLFLVQLPHTLPSIESHLTNQFSKAAIDCGPNVSERAQDALYSDPLSSGKLGKLTIFRSGKVRLQLGSMNFVVDNGLDRLFSENIVQINSVKNHLVSMGSVHSRLVVYPELSSESE